LLDLTLFRFVFVLVISGCGFYFRPFQMPPLLAGLLGAFGAALIIGFEIRLEKFSLKRLIGAAIGVVIGCSVAFLIAVVLSQVNPDNSTTLHFVEITVLLWFMYLGLALGARKGDLLNLSALGGVFGGETNAAKRKSKILDTSVIIDGRVADIAETGFLDGVVVIPQFVLRELQFVADSADSTKRNRGRRGLDVLQRLQKMSNLDIQISEEDFPQVREVDLKLIELAKVHDGKIVTNDFNLNKVAQVRGVEVLNINELANSLKPVVLPGEYMRVFILKEGKEYNQGVAYLDDGTMVVVDNARKMIGKNVDVCVTTVLQTTAGKMIFGKYDERPHSASAQRDGVGQGVSNGATHSHEGLARKDHAAGEA